MVAKTIRVTHQELELLFKLKIKNLSMIKKKSCFIEKNYNYKFQKDKISKHMSFLIPGFWYLEGKNNQEEYFKKKIFLQQKYIHIKKI